MSSFSIYLIGFVIVVIGLAIGASMLGAPPQWIAVGALVLLGIGVVSGVGRTKRKDPPEV